MPGKTLFIHKVAMINGAWSKGPGGMDSGGGG